MSFCRGCLVIDADVFHSLFSKIETIPVQDMFQTLTGLTVCREDGLPRYICQECCQGLLKFYKLREKFIESNAFLRSSFVPAAANRNERARIEQENNASNKSLAPTEPTQIHSGNDHSSGDENDSDESVSLVETGTTITESIEIDLVTEEPASVLSGSNDFEGVKESFEACEFDVFEDENRSEYLITELDGLDESEQTANSTVVEEAPEGPLIFCCGCPNVRFNSKAELAQHSQDKHAKDRSVNNVRPYECDICYKRFMQCDYLEHHKTLPYRERKYHCNEPGCDAQFLGRSALLSHRKSKHLGVRSYACDLCEKSFLTSSTLRSHLKIHTRKEYQCKTCMKLFRRQADLITHQMTHSDERPFSCGQCHSRFKTRNHLRTHEYVHSTQPRLTCELCDATFSTYTDRRVHVLGHDNIYPNKCSFCNRVYKRNSKLQGHIRRVHTGERPHGCTQCSQKFFESRELTAHIRSKHSSDGRDDPAGVLKMEEDDDCCQRS